MSRWTQTLEERFFDKVKKTKTCWVWTAGDSGTGYGRIKVRNVSKAAHRLSWQMHKGKIPLGFYVLHTCDNRACVNPAHLYLGTQFDNMRDMSARKRHWGLKKTHCPQGHPYSEENTYRQKHKPGRQCRICKAANGRASKERRRQRAIRDKL